MYLEQSNIFHYHFVSTYTVFLITVCLFNRYHCTVKHCNCSHHRWTVMASNYVSKVQQQFITISWVSRKYLYTIISSFNNYIIYHLIVYYHHRQFYIKVIKFFEIILYFSCWSYIELSIESFDIGYVLIPISIFRRCLWSRAMQSIEFAA